MPALKVGIIGCGRIAQLVHLDILSRLPDSELIALAETDPQRRAEAKRRVPRAIVFADYQELLAVPGLEAVVICLPNALHAEAAIAALKRGKHVYLEKPLATSLDEARRVLAAWRRAGVVGMIGFNFRYNALYQAARAHIQSGRLGQLVGVRSVFSSSSRTRPTWEETGRAGEGALLNLASHHIDLVHFLFDRPVDDVCAQVRSQHCEGDSATLQMRLGDGLPILSFCTTNSVDEDQFEIYGETEKATVDRYYGWNVEIGGSSRECSRISRLRDGFRTLVGGRYLVKKIFVPRCEPSYREALARFVGAAGGKHSASPDLWDGYKSLAVVEAAMESARTGRVVHVTRVTHEDFAYK